jgi:hypothetical protein
MNQSKTAFEIETRKQLNTAETAIVESLLYFDTFKYPLRLNEIFNFCTTKYNNETEVQDNLDLLISKKLVKKNGPYYYVNDDDSIVNRREAGNKMAEQVMPKAIKYGKFIAQFPFVETVCISGSLSKNYFDEKGDVDFFIITKPQRLWLCRSILVGFKKMFLLNSRKYFCVNYFVGSDNLSIPDRNVFTATEIASLIPVNDLSGYAHFILKNEWIYSYLPNFNPSNKINYNTHNEKWPKKISEKLLGGALGNFADKQLFKLTLNIWQKKFKHFNKTDFDLNMRSRKNVSKHHPNGFQQKVLDRWSLSKQAYCKKYNVEFSN